MTGDSKFRHELKYVISKRDMDCCISRLKEFADLDKHAECGGYFVRSLYYDDQYRSAYYDKESGIASRCKYRIRIYDMDDGYISLEKKIKEGAFVRKESAVLTREEYDRVIKGDTGFLLKRSEKTANDFAIECLVNRLRPEVIVDYDRIPFVSVYGNVRITFDMNVRSVFGETDVFSTRIPSYEVMGQDELIMEVKYTEFLPDIFRAILPIEGSRRAVSKFIICDEMKMNFKEVL